MLDLSKVNQYYGSSHTLKDISFSLAKGECLVVMGRNGVGKTTLLDSIMGLLSNVSGEILYNNTNLLTRDAADRAHLKIGYVPQGRRIFPLLTVEENLKIGLAVTQKKEIPAYIFDLFPVLKDMLSRLGGNLSGGQQQQLAIARALVIEPEILLLDEPTEGIQPNVIAEICAVINKLNTEFGLTVLMVEQKLPIAKSVSNAFVILDRGSIVANGKMEDLDSAIIKKYLTV